MKIVYIHLAYNCLKFNALTKEHVKVWCLLFSYRICLLSYQVIIVQISKLAPDKTDKTPGCKTVAINFIKDTLQNQINFKILLEN
jgi:hypothetical protein